METPTTPTIGASLNELASPVLESTESHGSIESIINSNNDKLDLPAELWFLIFSQLDVVSLLVVSQVHRRWTRITNDPTLWRDLCFQHLVSLNDEETKRIFEESLTPGAQLNAWKKIFIRHHKTEQRNRVLGKLFWASYEFTALQRFLNLPSVQGARNGTSARLLTYEGQSVACRQCERERELLELLDVSTANGKFFHVETPKYISNCS